ncbi:MAG: DUF6112 family protein [Bifidobacteriaceae bacterium]|jgi:uncharacterized membrane protein|nr:DUF6112 family protein [Bifidobacteriaceae bacterium]
MSPDFSAANGTVLASVVGALLTIVLVAAVAALIASAICWAYGEANGNYQLSAKGKTGVLIALGTAIAAGAGIAWMNFLLRVGETL